MSRRSLAIIVVAHNVGPFIHACLSSCARAGDDLEIHLNVINDSSTDETAAEIEQFTNEHPDIDVTVKNTERLGPALARNEGLQLNGFADYVCFVDGDDLICGDALARTIAKMEAFELTSRVREFLPSMTPGGFTTSMIMSSLKMVYLQVGATSLQRLEIRPRFLILRHQCACGFSTVAFLEVPELLFLILECAKMLFHRGGLS